MPETPEQVSATLSPQHLSRQLAFDYEIVYKEIVYQQGYNAQREAERIFGPQEAAVLKAIAENPQASKLVDDYWEKVPVPRSMNGVSLDPGTSIPLSQLEREFLEDYKVLSLAEHSPFAACMGFMMLLTGHSMEEAKDAVKLAHPYGELAGALAEVAEAEREPQRPGDPYQRQYSPEQKWERPSPEKPDKPPDPGPLHERPFQPVAPEGSAKPQHGHPGSESQHQPLQPAAGPGSEATGGSQGSSGHDDGSGGASGSTASSGGDLGQARPAGDTTAGPRAPLATQPDANFSNRDGTESHVDVSYPQQSSASSGDQTAVKANSPTLGPAGPNADDRQSLSWVPADGLPSGQPADDWQLMSLVPADGLPSGQPADDGQSLPPGPASGPSGQPADDEQPTADNVADAGPPG